MSVLMGFDFGALLLQDSSLCSMAILSGAILSSDAAKKNKNRLPGFMAFFRGFTTQYCAQQSHHATQAMPITVCQLFDLRCYFNQLLPQGEGLWYLCGEILCLGGWDL